MPPDSQYSMPLHYQFVFHTKPENYKKKELMIYVTLATKLENHKKIIFMIHVHVIHVCLDIAPREGDLYPL